MQLTKPSRPQLDTKAGSTNADDGQACSFPWKLHQMLDESEKDGFGDVVSWQADGRSFRVHKPDDFVEKVLPGFFKQTKYASFQRQLNLYGFNRLTQGPYKGAYFHKCFIRGAPNLCQGMIRKKVKGIVEAARPRQVRWNVEPSLISEDTKERTVDIAPKIFNVPDYVSRQLPLSDSDTRENDSHGGEQNTMTKSLDQEDRDLTEGKRWIKEGDVIFFEGQHFHYIEHLEHLHTQATNKEIPTRKTSIV